MNPQRATHVAADTGTSEPPPEMDTRAGYSLVGRTVLVTRSRHQAKDLQASLAALGARVVNIPTVEVRALPVNARIKTALEALDRTHFVVFTSANAVDAVFTFVRDLSCDAQALRRTRICAVGIETAAALATHGISAELVSGEYSVRGMAQLLAQWDVRRRRVLIARARQNRDGLRAILANRGAHIDDLAVYEIHCPPGVGATIRRLWGRAFVDAVTFTGTATLGNFVHSLRDGEAAILLRHTVVACMGPVTARTARRLGLRVDVVAHEYDTGALASGLASHFAGGPLRPARRTAAAARALGPGMRRSSRGPRG